MVNYSGYWIFYCNPKYWDIESFLLSNRVNELYTITEWQKDYFTKGQIGVIRVGKDNRTKIELNGKKKLESGIYAIVEITDEPQYIEDPNKELWTSENERSNKKYRVGLKVINNLLNTPLLISDLKNSRIKDDKYLINGFQSSTMPLEKESMNYILSLINNDITKKQYEVEVISIPASKTIELIYKYSIHAHPDKVKGYSYKNAVYYTFRETSGIMKVLYTLEECILLNPKKDYSIVLDNMNITEDIKKRIINYIEERKRIYGFDYDGNYKIYILNEAIKLNSPKKFPKSLRNHTYSKIEYFFYDDNIIHTIKSEDTNLIDDSEFYEGNMITIKQNKYERNPKARRECLKHYGCKCQICGFDFEEFYGEIGKDVIEVHHRKALSEIKENYTVDPIRDLVPVCSNCHTIIHSRKPYYTVEELKSILDFKK